MAKTIQDSVPGLTEKDSTQLIDLFVKTRADSLGMTVDEFLEKSQLEIKPNPYAEEMRIVYESNKSPDITQGLPEGTEQFDLIEEIKSNIANNIKIDQSFRDHFEKEEYGSIVRKFPGFFTKAATVTFDEVAEQLKITTDELAQKLRDYKKPVKPKKTKDASFDFGTNVKYQQGINKYDKLEQALIENKYDETIPKSRYIEYGKSRDVTISPSTPKDEAFVKLRRFLIDNPKGYDILGGRTAKPDAEYLNPKPTKLFQGERGALEITDNGKAIMHLLENADPSTIAHEFVHLYTTQGLLLKDEIPTMEDFVGKKYNECGTEEHEKIASAGEKYFMERKAPSGAMKEILEKIKKWLGEIYKGVKAGSLDIKLTPKMVELFDRWFGYEVGKPTITPSTKETTKQIVRRTTGQVKLSDLVREDKALEAAVKKAEQSARIAFREGKKEGVEKEKVKMRNMQQSKKIRAVRDCLTYR